MSSPIKFTAKQVKFLETFLTAEQMIVLKTTASLPEPKKVQEEKEQCISSTTKGSRCKKTCNNGETTCSVHKKHISAEFVSEPEVEEKVICSSITKKGVQCKKIASKGGDKCSVHEGAEVGVKA